MLHDRVMVRVDAGAGARGSNAGIVIPAAAQGAKRVVCGEVYGVGNHVRQVKSRNPALFNPEEQFEVQGQAYPITRERDLRAVAHELREDGTGLYLQRVAPLQSMAHVTYSGVTDVNLTGAR